MKMRFCTALLLPIIAILTIHLALRAQTKEGMFRHHYISRDLPGDAKWGYGNPALADFDKDGDLDFTVSIRDGNIYWFEYRGPEDWVQHILGTLPGGCLGSVSMDVDRDGWMDLVIGGVWFRNTGNPRVKRFERFVYDSSVDKYNAVHDIVAADIDGDGKNDIVTMGEREGCNWYSIPDNPARDADWQKAEITMSVLVSQDQIHAGFFPGGVGDLDGDGDADVVLPDRWYQNKNAGREWVKHFLPFGKRGLYGISSRSVIIDIDNDGDNDIVMTDTDQDGSMVAVLESNGKTPPYFTRRHLLLKAPGIRGSLHSLQVADFDNDGDMDILTGEQEDPDIFPIGATPRCYIFENVDGTGKKFEERVIVDSRLGFHDILIGDVDGDGDIDFCSKIWNRWLENANGGLEHVDYYENLHK